MSLICRAPILTHTNWLPGLIKRLEVEDVDTPIQSPTDRRRPERLGARHARDRTLVLVPGSRPPRLTNPQLGSLGRGPRHLLDVPKCLHDVVEKAARGIGDILALPVTESIAEQDVRATSDEGVGAAVLVLAPGISSADLECIVGGLLDLVDLAQKLRPREVTPVKRL